MADTKAVQYSWKKCIFIFFFFFGLSIEFLLFYTGSVKQPSKWEPEVYDVFKYKFILQISLFVVRRLKTKWKILFIGKPGYSNVFSCCMQTLFAMDFFCLSFMFLSLPINTLENIILKFTSTQKNRSIQYISNWIGFVDLIDFGYWFVLLESE